MRLLLFNLVTDADDPVLGFTTTWIAAIAKRVEAVHVITMRAGRIQVPSNVTVTSVGKEKGYSEPRRALEFYRTLLRILHTGDIQICFSHMMPLFTVLAGPALRLRCIPIVTWFAHPSLKLTLRLAHHLSDRMVSSLLTAYPYRTDKLVVVGQGIDTDLFFPESDEVGCEPPIILCVGRLSPVKGQMTLIEAAALLRRRFHGRFLVRMIGGPAKSEDHHYATLLRQRINDLGLEKVVEFQAPVPMTVLPSHYRHATVHVNLTPTGSGDKAALEAMSCGRICILANEGFRETLGQFADRFIFHHGDPVHLAKCLEEALLLTQKERTQIGTYLSAQILAKHSLDGLVCNLLDVFQKLSK